MTFDHNSRNLEMTNLSSTSWVPIFLLLLRLGCFPTASCALVFLQLRFRGRLSRR
jgi:hypothetical protein